MINDGQPIEELAETVSGHPFHGLVRGGVLVLPNGVQMTYRQPVGGNTYVFKKPGIAVITRSPADQITDTAAGYQWRNYALISGGNSQLYGHDLGVLAWIYLAADGSRWQVRLMQTYATFSLTSWDFYFAVSRFGDFGIPAESYTIHTTLTDLGQPSAQNLFLRMNANIGGTNYIIANQITAGTFWLSDVSPDGSEAIIGMDGDIDPNLTSVGALPAWMGEQGMPLGFLKFNFSGSGPSIAVSGSILYTRAQVMPTMSKNGTVLTTSSNATIEPNAAPCTFDSVGRIVAVWYDQNGTAQPVKIDKHVEYLPVAIGGPAVTANSSYTLTYGVFTTSVVSSNVAQIGGTYVGTSGYPYTYNWKMDAGFWTDSGSTYLLSSTATYASDFQFRPGPETAQSAGWSVYGYADYPGGLLPLYDFMSTPFGATPFSPIFYRRLSNRCIGILAKHDIATEHSILALLTRDGVPTNVDLYSGAGIGTKSTQPLPHNLGLYMPNSVPCTTSDPGTTNVGLDISGQNICYV